MAEQVTSKERYEIQQIQMPNGQGIDHRITDTMTDSRVATCYHPDNARLVCDALNAYSAPEPPAAPERMRISYQPVGRCLWHDDCDRRLPGIMRVVQEEQGRSLLECLHCKKRGYYPVGSVGAVCVDVVSSAQPPGALPISVQGLLSSIIETDPDDMVADAVTALDAWRKRAAELLGRSVTKCPEPARKDLQHPDAGPRGDRYPFGDPQ